jgi:prevent-host-death family protein
MAKIDVDDANHHLPNLLERVEQGEEIVIAQAGYPVAKLVRIEAPKARHFGLDVGRFVVPDDFNEPLPDELLKAFYA